jgi:DNA-directed RNA polymerase beta' subunit
MKLRLIPLDRGFKPEATVTDPSPVVEKTGKFTDGGVFSDRIFGRMPSSGREYTCDCGCMDGRFYDGFECQACGTPVVRRETVFAKRGWADLGEHRIISPLFYVYFSRVIGPTALGKILQAGMGRGRKLSVDGVAVGDARGSNYENLGMLGFLERWEEVLAHFEAKKRSDPKAAAFAALIRRNRGLIFTSKIPVFSHILRPALVVDKKLIFDDVNNVYNLLLANVRALAEYSGPERTSAAVNGALWRIQERANELFEHVLQSLSRKQGYIRGSLLGVRVNFSARAVITPLPPGHEQDEIHVPYLVFLELYKFQLLNLLQRSAGVSIREANEIWCRAQTTFDRRIHTSMRLLIKRAGGGLPALLNRNPTIAFGSILRVRITGVKDDFSDLTLSLNNLVLSPLGGDFDGDVLSVIPLMDEDFDKAFEVFDPRLMMVSRDKAGMNPTMAMKKDHVLGLHVLTEDALDAA